MITIATCDDSTDTLKVVSEYIEKYVVECEEKIRGFSYENGAQLLEDYQGHFDIIFLDIRMPGKNGLQVADEIRKRDDQVSIYFLTSLIEYAVEGYKVGAASYIMKPMNYKRFKMELDKWRIKNRQRDEPFILFHNNEGKYKVLLKKLSHIETHNRKILIHTDSSNIVCYWKLKEVEEKIGGYGFARCHTSYVVNLAYIESIERMDIKLITGDTIPMSKTKKKEFMKRLAQYWGEQI